jgi:hypothetical protein
MASCISDTKEVSFFFFKFLKLFPFNSVMFPAFLRSRYSQHSMFHMPSICVTSRQNNVQNYSSVYFNLSYDILQRQGEDALKLYYPLF